MGKVFTLLLACLSFTAWSQVGINTTDPQEKLHIAGTTGTLRVDYLNHENSFSVGDADGDGNLDNNTNPLYVNEHGDFTLEIKVLENTGAEDAFDDTEMPEISLYAWIIPSDTDGYAEVEIKAYTFTITRPTLLQVKYNISHLITDSWNAPIADGLARRVDNFIRVTPDPDPTDGVTNREYGPSSRTYTSASAYSVTGPFYNGHTAYIKFLPPPEGEEYTLKIFGRASSNLPSLHTKVKFAVDYDFLFFKLY